MSTVVKGFKGKWNGAKYNFLDADVDISASRAAGVWLIDGDKNNEPLCMVVGSPMEEDAARRYAIARKALGQAPPVVYRVFPLVNLAPIGLTDVVDEDGDETWSAFQDAWIEVRL